MRPTSCRVELTADQVARIEAAIPAGAASGERNAPAAMRRGETGR